MVKVEDRFEAKVDRSGDCHEWTGRRHRQGYGEFDVGSRTDGTRRSVMAHRMAWELVNGPIPDGLIVRHKVCDNPCCVNTDHLALGTHLDNAKDRDSKGRRAPPIGELNGKAKITELQAIDIKAYYVQECKPRDIATFMKAPLQVVQRICYGITWKHI